MALEYLRQTLITGVDDAAAPDSNHTRPEQRLSKGKFALLFGGNLIVWIIFGVSLLGVDGFSKDAISLPKIPQKLMVSGIVYSEASPSVIISNQVYGIGDVVEGYTVSRITPTEVEFRKDDKKIIRQVH